MFFIDTHTHLDFEYEENVTPEKIVKEAEDVLVTKIITISSDVASIQKSFDIASKFPNVYHSIGVHPHEAKDFSQEVEKDMRKLKGPKCVAIGEIGLDFFYQHSPKDTQKNVFVKQIELAHELKLPLIMHVRDADKEAYDILKTELKDLKAVLHCYSGTKDQLKKYLDLGMYASFTGIITFPKAIIAQEAAIYAPDDRIMLETDSPFLTPVPFRGQKNYPKHIPLIAQKLAELRNQTLENIADLTSKNANTLFGI
jgi:TatD DNase family protein